MTKRQAKSEACYHAALQLATYLHDGWILKKGWDEETEAKMEDAMVELIDELERRARKSPK